MSSAVIPASLSSPSNSGGGGGAAGSDSPDRSASPLPIPTVAITMPSTKPSSRRLPPPCWTNEETHELIDCYREKWYALRRGNLRAPHWQEVADAVAQRCHRLSGATPKTAVQCRHKIEKLRKRYRAERQRSLAADPSTPPSSSWILFRKMDAMERGAGGATAGGGSSSSARPSPAAAAASALSENDDDEDDVHDNDDGDEEDLSAANHVAGSGSRAFHSLPGSRNNGSGGLRRLRFNVPKAMRSKTVGSRTDERSLTIPTTGTLKKDCFFQRKFGGFTTEVEEMRKRVEKRKRITDRDEGDAVEEMVSAMGMLVDRFMRIEQMKMEQAREVERERMEIELKRTQMIIDSQRRIVDAFVKGRVGKKRIKAPTES